MSFVFELDTEAAKEVSTGGSKFGVVDTGVYEGKIKYASLGQTKNGNNTVDITFESDGREFTLWGMCIDREWKSGAKNFDFSKWQQLAVACGMKSGDTSPFALKKDDGTLIKNLTVFRELHGVGCTLAVQKELDFYNGEVRERNRLHSSYAVEDVNVDKVASRLKDYETKAYKAQGKAAPVIEVEEDEGSLL